MPRLINHLLQSLRKPHGDVRCLLNAHREHRAVIGIFIASLMLLGQGCSTLTRDRLPPDSAAKIYQTVYQTESKVAPETASGIASGTAPKAAPVLGFQPSITDCLAWYGHVDTAIDAVGVRDAGTRRMAGFPHLRIDRFAASFREEAFSERTTEQHKRTMLLRYARDLDWATREDEIANLPQAWRETNGLTDIKTVRAAISRCSEILINHDLTTMPASLQAQWQVPDHYSRWQRIVGLYAITSIPFFMGVRDWQQKTENVFAASAQITHDEHTNFMRYRLATEAEGGAGGGTNIGTDVGNIEAKFSNSLRSVLGIPQLSEADWQVLLNRHAPIIDIETNGNFDRPGELKFNAHKQLTVNPAAPVVYQRVSFTRFNGKTHVQLTYSVWFSERPKTGAFDLLGGPLDNIMLRITLDHDGLPMLVDSIHGCGCYHLFFPTPRLMPVPAPQNNMEWAFIPKILPRLAAGQRLVVKIASATHYLTDIRIANPTELLSTPTLTSTSAPTSASAVQFYNLRPERELLSLPIMPLAPLPVPTPPKPLLPPYEQPAHHPPLERRSIYASSGLVNGTERGERFLFWPMGILSPGAMRQWGTHATAFVGIRHFDDADLIDKRFRIVNTNSANPVENVNQREMIGAAQK